MGTEELQKLHYDRIGTKYESHYGDLCSRQYRDQFIKEPMFEGVELSSKNVLEAMSGNGQTTEYLLSKGAKVTGLDISTAECDSFRDRFPNCEVRCRSIFDSGFANDPFDCVAIVGGLHHLHPDISKAVNEIHRVLKLEVTSVLPNPITAHYPI
jgi:SAM-dependent methyltransferase